MVCYSCSREDVVEALSRVSFNETAITVSLVRGDHETASSVMFLLGVGDLLEEWAHKKSVEDLAGMMALNVDKAWIDDAGTERLVSVNDIAAGDIALGVFGVITPATSAMLHNLSTIGISVYNMTDLIEDR